MPETKINDEGAAPRGRNQRRRGTRARIGLRSVLAIMAVFAMLVVGMGSGAQTADAADDLANTDGHVSYVTIPGSDAGWAVGDGQRQWLAPDCRAQLEGAGVTFAFSSWTELSMLTRAEPGPCPTAPGAPRFVILNNKKGAGAGWVVQNGTREWLSPDCRQALQAAGVQFHVTTWTELSTNARLEPGDCDRFLPASNVRFATFNASLNRDNAGDLVAELTDAASGTVTAQLEAVLQTIAVTRPDVLLVNEFDYDASHEAAALFAGLADYPYWYTAPSNTGVASGFDLDNDGSVGGPGDAFGFGFHEGQFGMLVLSRYPIDTANIRTFQNFLWRDMPGALLPTNPDSSSWYSPEELNVFRLSSKSHWDVPIQVNGDVIHFLVSHPTPPVFDGEEDRNGTRNHDEIRLWADYVSGAGYIYDDDGMSGGLGAGEAFVIAGDQNSDPNDGDSIPGAAQQLLDHPRVNTSKTPSAVGGVEAAAQGDPNQSHSTPPRFDTADFGETQFGGPGNLRVDYVLPSTDLTITAAAVFWPGANDPLSALTGSFPFPASDHRLVWVEVA